MATKLQIRRDTASNWTSANPTLSAGELGFETDTYKLKIGNGSTAWSSLEYFNDQIGFLDSSAIIGLLGNGSVQHIIPSGNELYDLGDSNSRFRDLYLSGSSIKLGTATITADSAGTLTLPAGTQIGSGAVLDSANVLSLISASYIQSNQITYNNNDFADSAFVTTQINNLIDGAPGTLNTLNEIAAALNDDDSAYGTLLGLINAKTDYDSADTLGLIDSSYIQARQSSVGTGGLDSAAVTTLVDSAYVQARQTAASSGVDSAATIALINNNTNSGFFRYKYSATAGQTAFQDSDLNGNVMSFDPNSTLVFYNGVLLNDSDDYTASSNTVTLTSGADAGSQVSVVKYGVGYTPPPYPWGGDRGLTGGGNLSSTSPYHSNVIDYFDITTPGNATDFGDLNKLAQNATGVSNGTRAVFMGGGAGDGSGSVSTSNTMDYITIATTSNATDFGDLSTSVSISTGDNKADGTYGLVTGFRTTSTNVNNIEYITIASTSNTTDFGDLTQARTQSASCSDGTYAIITGGMDTSSNLFNIIDYITIASPSNASDFGDLLAARVDQAAVSSTTVGLIGGGRNSSYQRPVAMEYVMIATPGNATTAGDLFDTSNADGAGASSNGTYGTWNGGSSATNIIQRVTISTSGNAADFGDLTVARGNSAGTAGNAS